jgi:hypothetical protein
MAKVHRRQTEEVAQGVLLDDPAFLREIVERVLQILLKTEIGRARRRRPLRAHHRAHMASQRPQAPHPEDAGGYAEPARPPG